MSVDICLTTTPAATVPLDPLTGTGLMKFNRLRVAALPPLSRQLTTSTIGKRTGSTPASFEPRTSASEVPPCVPHVGSTNPVVAVGTISASLPPTWNWVALGLTHTPRAGDGRIAAAVASKHAATATRPRNASNRFAIVDVPGHSVGTALMT